MNTLQLARKHGAGAVLIGTETNTRWLVSDWSDGNGDVYGWPLVMGIRGKYQRLPRFLSIAPPPDLGPRTRLGIIPSEHRFRHVKVIAGFSNGLTCYERDRRRMALLLEGHERSKLWGFKPGKLEYVVRIKKWKSNGRKEQRAKANEQYANTLRYLDD